MRAMVKGYVRKAFAAIEDLAEDVTFINNSRAKFDFTLGEASENVAQSFVFRAVVTKQMHADTNTMITKILLMTEDLRNVGILSPDVFDKVTVRGTTLSVILSSRSGLRNEDNGYTTTIYAAEEVS